ncbi:hypothetical protein L3V79_03165 [Thiotrichales bacterium 19S9-12]|nr:hypothetical protein [Thiotrichales bacterium 19S9-11]MCF6811360.1 hypothetical protein [Thiotrichales bacterium 19S9-12]
MALKAFYLLADGGGTKTDLQLLDEHYNVLASYRSSAGNIKTSPHGAWQSISDGVDIISKREKIEIDQLNACLGMAGSESQASLEKFKGLKPNYIKSLDVLSDAHIACLGAHKGEDGALIIIGTGTKGFQIEGDQIVDIAGWGFPHSDEGSGAWLGIEAVRHTFQAVDSRVEHSLLSELILKTHQNNPLQLLEQVVTASAGEFGQFSQYVVTCAQQNDPVSLGLIQAAAREIEKIANALKYNQKNKKEIPIAFTGGLSNYMLPYLSESVRSRAVDQKGNALDGALYFLKKQRDVLR